MRPSLSITRSSAPEATPSADPSGGVRPAQVASTRRLLKRRSAGRDVVHGRGEPRLCFAKLLFLRRTETRVGEIHAALPIDRDAVGAAEWQPIESIGEHSFLSGRPHDPYAREPRLRLKRDEPALAVERHPKRAMEIADECRE